MKKSIFILGAVCAIALTSCKKTEVVDTNSNADTLNAIEVVDNDSMPITNDSTVNAIDNAAVDAKVSTENAVKEGAQSVKEGAKDATDGDGNVTK